MTTSDIPTPSPLPGRLNLFCSPRSPFVRRVMVAAHELGLAQDLHCIDTVVAMTGCHAGLMQINPLNKIPTLITEDGAALFDTVLICEYLDSVAAVPSLFPQARTARLQSMRWHALGHGLTDLLVLWRNERNRPPAKQSGEVMRAWGSKASATLGRLQTEVAALQAAPLSIGQIAVACALGYLDFRFEEMRWRDSVPVLGAWFDGFNQRASMQATLPALA
ncbi:glutathione S-transferase family protein [Cupriavidus sp. CV2]|uniref:glutathione S-transferase family protein n=1 Tax=Cupriavidus ulmosensis TaxID=3065913 RepID=UPI00296AEE30|nr:glutathione S-transferase family protein [Cupriavidus sp. CV2]MDW3684187.1 glutathione S-transferase family protein [Cupriavidus sp. CV2]